MTSNSSTTSSPHVDDVVIVGAGLAGSAAAAFLSHAGRAAVVLERHEEPGARPRAWIMSSRTMELFRELGLEDRVRTVGTPGAWNEHVVETLLDVPIGPDPVVDRTAAVSAAGSAACDQDIQEGLLRDHAVQRGTEFRWGRSVTGLVDRGDHVEVLVDGEAPLLARFVVVADGARASLLPQLGIATSRPGGDLGKTLDQVLFRSAELDELMADRPGKVFICTAGGDGVFRRDLGRWQLHRMAGDIDDVEDAVAGAVGRRVAVEVLDHSSWTPTSQLADTFRAGNVFVIGDAAHSMPPSLGMAGNLAIADAHNLAWKLAWVLTGLAGPGLLDSYEPERRPVDELVLDQSIVHLTSEDVLDQIVIELGLGYPAGASPALAGTSAELTTNDPRDLFPVVGARLPHQWLPDGRSTLDLVRTDTFIAVGAAEGCAGPVPYHRIPGLAPRSERQVWLVRPDGHVAAQLQPEDVPATLDTLLDRSGRP